MQDILVVPANHIRGLLLDITDVAMPGRFRLMDCVQFGLHNTLRIVELDDLSNIAYSAISYVWCGNPLEDWQETRGTFAVKGAEDADPISMDVLYHASIASIQHQADYLWIDRLCIMQRDHEDKSWQIARMFSIYQSSRLCIVLPGGLQKLVRLDEETGWIHRAWTLQECLAPPLTLVLFAWDGDASDMLIPYSGVPNFLLPVVYSESAVSQLRMLVDASYEGSIEIYSLGHSLGDVYTEQVVKILASARAPSLAALGAAMLKQAGPDFNAHAIWKCALMRTSSRPVDMVFSIMGLFGVTLDPKAFHPDDRLGATFILSQELLRRGHRATWLGASLLLPPAKQLSSFARFPQTSVSGEALIQIDGTLRRAEDVMNMDFPNALFGIRLPLGSMDDRGYLAFTAPTLPLAPYDGSSEIEEQNVLTAVDDTKWVTSDKHRDLSTLAVLLGWYDGYMPGRTPRYNNNLKAMLVKEHTIGRFHVHSYFNIDHKLLDWVKAWKMCELMVGGQEPLQFRRKDVPSVLDGGVSSKQVYLTQEDPKADNQDYWYPGIPWVEQRSSNRILIQFRRPIPPTERMDPAAILKAVCEHWAHKDGGKPWRIDSFSKASYTDSGDISLTVEGNYKRPSERRDIPLLTFMDGIAHGRSPQDYVIVLQEQWYCLDIKHIPNSNKSDVTMMEDACVSHIMRMNLFLPRYCISRLCVVADVLERSQALSANQSTFAIRIAFNMEPAASASTTGGLFIEGKRHFAHYTIMRPEEGPLH